MSPDFAKKTIDALAKRAAYICSNPDCRASTVGPHSEDSKTTIIGEAAHVFAARAGYARHDSKMTDRARSEITNGIWLCRNCHQKVDRDPIKFSADLLFAWRENHEAYVASNLGSKADKTRFEIEQQSFAKFVEYPPLVKRILHDKPPGWEFILTAALMRHLNAPHFRRLADVRDGVCALPTTFLNGQHLVDWASERRRVMVEMVGPLKKILDRFNHAWGDLGESGDADEIHHTALLLRDALGQIVKHEEELHCVRVPPNSEKLVGLLRNALGSQVEKFRTIPNWLESIVEMAIRREESGLSSEPLVIEKTIEFTLPDGWSDEYSEALRQIEKESAVGFFRTTNQPAQWIGRGCTLWIVILAVAFMVIQIL